MLNLYKFTTDIIQKPILIIATSRKEAEEKLFYMFVESTNFEYKLEEIIKGFIII